MLTVGAYRDRILVASLKKNRWPSRQAELGIEQQLQLARPGWLVALAEGDCSMTIPVCVIGTA